MTRLSKEDKYTIIKKHDFRVLNKTTNRGISYELSKPDKEGNVTLTRLEIVDSSADVDHDVIMTNKTGTYNFNVRNLYIFQNKLGYFFSIKESINPDLSVILEKDLEFCKANGIAFFKTSKDFSTKPVKKEEVLKVETQEEIKTCSSKEKKDCKCPLKKVRKTVWNTIKSLFKKG